MSVRRFRVRQPGTRYGALVMTLAFVLVACGGDAESGNGNGDDTGDDALVNEAQTIFIEQGCAECHGEQGEGTGEPRTEIAGTRMIIQAFTTRVRNGRGAAMPGYSEEQISEEEIQFLHDWLRNK